MIELAPTHKVGLQLDRPVMPASGFFGYGRPAGKLIDAAAFGAIVTGPVTLRPVQGAAPPRLAETGGGFVLETGGQNPGVRHVIRHFASFWQRLGVPVIAHLPATPPEDLARTARALESAGGVAAFELGLPEACNEASIGRWLDAIHQASELPVLTKLPWQRAASLAQIALQAGSDALVVATPPRAAGVIAPGVGVALDGHYFGHGLHALTLSVLGRVAEFCDRPLIASGGIHTLAEARAFLEAGAVAIQLDSLLFVDPGAALRLIEAL